MTGLLPDPNWLIQGLAARVVALEREMWPSRFCDHSWINRQSVPCKDGISSCGVGHFGTICANCRAMRKSDGQIIEHRIYTNGNPY